MSDISPRLDYKPELPQCLHHCIGIIGAGGIVNDARLGRLQGSWILSRRHYGSRLLEGRAHRHGTDELLCDSQIEIVDTTVYPAQQVAIVEPMTGRAGSAKLAADCPASASIDGTVTCARRRVHIRARAIKSFDMVLFPVLSLFSDLVPGEAQEQARRRLALRPSRTRWKRKCSSSTVSFLIPVSCPSFHGCIACDHSRHSE